MVLEWQNNRCGAMYVSPLLVARSAAKPTAWVRDIVSLVRAEYILRLAVCSAATSTLSLRFGFRQLVRSLARSLCSSVDRDVA